MSIVGVMKGDTGSLGLILSATEASMSSSVKSPTLPSLRWEPT